MTPRSLLQMQELPRIDRVECVTSFRYARRKDLPALVSFASVLSIKDDVVTGQSACTAKVKGTACPVDEWCVACVLYVGIVWDY